MILTMQSHVCVQVTVVLDDLFDLLLSRFI
jgi:hypothetical protein